jgi:hypothetical protein
VSIFLKARASPWLVQTVCAIDGYNEVWDDEDRIMKYYFAGCTVTFVSSTLPYKCGYQWEVDGLHRLPCSLPLVLASLVG